MWIMVEKDGRYRSAIDIWKKTLWHTSLPKSPVVAGGNRSAPIYPMRQAAYPADNTPVLHGKGDFL